MEYETIGFEVNDSDGVATIALNRPEVMNAFNQPMCAEFANVWATVRDDKAIHAVVLRSNGGRAFSTGVDVAEALSSPMPSWTSNARETRAPTRERR